jgi:hypothetical protein
VAQSHSPTTILRRLRYRVDQVFAMGLPVQLGIVGLISTLGALLGGVAFHALIPDPDNLDAQGLPRDLDGGLVDGLWWAARHVLDPGATEDDYAATWKLVTLGLVLSLLGMMLFGSVIALVATHLERRLRLLADGTGPVMEEGHVLILGHGRRARAVIRRGRPSLPADLDRVNVAEAGRVVVMAVDRSETDPVANDIEVIKTLTALSAVHWPGPRPPMAAEVVDIDDLDVAKMAGNYQVPILTTGDVIGKLVVQCARQPGLSQVFSTIFGSPDLALRLATEPNLANRPMAEAALAYPDSIPLGICDVLELDDREVLIPDINPPDGRIIEPQERIILLGPPCASPIGPLGTPPETVLPEAPESGPRSARRIVLLGWNKNIPAIIATFADHMVEGGSLTVVSDLEPDTMERLITDDLPRPPTNLDLTFVKRPWLRRRHMVDLVAEADTVVLLSDQGDEGRVEDPDARVIMGLILLDSLAGSGQAHPDLHVVAEMVDSANARLMERRVGGTLRPELIVSPDVVSLLLIRIAENNILRVIVTEFLSVKGQEIYLKPAGAYVHPGEAVTFPDLMTRARARSEIALGIARHREGLPPEILINPPRGTRHILGDKDRVVVVALDIRWKH